MNNLSFNWVVELNNQRRNNSTVVLLGKSVAQADAIFRHRYGEQALYNVRSKIRPKAVE